MKLYAGIDAGQSGTSAVVGDENGAILGRGHAGPADEVAQDAASTRLHDALSSALRAALAQAGLDVTARFAAVVAGISGYEGRVFGKMPELPADTLTLMHDAPVAHAGALAGEPGVVIIAGTGSVAYGVNQAGATLTAGGWGYLFGDEGSAFWIARQMLAQAMRAEDRGEKHPRTDSLLGYFELPSLRAISRAFYTNRISRDRLAGYARDVLQAASAGEDSAAKLCAEAARALAELGRCAAERLGMDAPPVAVIGGLMNDSAFRQRTYDALHHAFGRANVVEPKGDPASGALLLARRGVAS